FIRSQGYTNPIEIMGNWGGRDLYNIHVHGAEIAATDTVVVNSTPQTMFGWQAYWGTTDNYYPTAQGGFFGVGVLTAAQAIKQFASQEPFAIEIGDDNYGGDANLDYPNVINAADAAGMTWLWWSWNTGAAAVDCPVSGLICENFVQGAPQGF